MACRGYRVLEADRTPGALCTSTNESGRQLALIDTAGELRIYDLINGGTRCTLAARLKIHSSPGCAKWGSAATRHLLALGTAAGSLSLVQYESGWHEVLSAHAHSGDILDLLWRHHDLLTASVDNSVSVFRLSLPALQLALLQRIDTALGWVTGLALLDDAVYVQNANGDLSLLDPISKSLRPLIRFHYDNEYDISELSVSRPVACGDSLVFPISCTDPESAGGSLGVYWPLQRKLLEVALPQDTVFATCCAVSARGVFVGTNRGVLWADPRHMHSLQPLLQLEGDDQVTVLVI